MDEPMMPDCEHHYASHVRGGLALHVRICMLCGAVDFDDLAEQAAAIRAAALREAADAYEDDPDSQWTTAWAWLNARAARIEQEATDG